MQAGRAVNMRTIPARLVCILVFATSSVLCSVASAQQSSANAPIGAAAARPLIEDAIKLMDAKDLDTAERKLDAAVHLDPNNTVAHVLRGSIYATKELWPYAEEEFTTAEKLDPSDLRIKFFLADLKFAQKQYDQARPLYLALKKDPDRGDLAAYNVFLCDLLGQHEAAAAKELAVFNDAMGNPSYYFANAAWSLYHHKMDEGKSWLDSANRIYPTRKILPYAQPLLKLGLILAKPV
jgi:Tfp pilus assembly protein PilF